MNKKKESKKKTIHHYQALLLKENYLCSLGTAKTKNEAKRRFKKATHFRPIKVSNSMTNMERWKFYMEEITSPDSFIRWGYYSMIASCLQRRVWRGSEHNPLFCPLYVILTGPPAVGKGRVIGEVAKMLKHHKLKDLETKDIFFNDDPHGNSKEAHSTKEKRIPLLINVGADSYSYQSLVLDMSKAVRVIWHKSGETTKKPYLHSSLTIPLEELSSMFRKNTNDLANFLLCAFDCKDYEYISIGRGTDFIRSCCLNILAGTTPTFIKTIFNDTLLTDGFASRTHFVMEEYPRFYRLAPPEYTKEQLAARDFILAHIKQLATLYGEVKFTKEANDFLEDWWKGEAQTNRPNNSNKLISYYGRKNISVQKLAMIIHFSDSVNFEVGIKECQEAISELAKIEKKMHMAVSFDNKNPIAKVTEDVLEFLKNNGATSKQELLIEFWGSLPEGGKSLDGVTQYLLSSKKICVEGGNKYNIKKD